MENVSELVWLYIKKRPFLKEMLRERIANYSALARKINLEVFGDRKRTNAVKMALVRLTGKITEKEEDLEGKILHVLKASSVSVRSKVAVIIASREIEGLKYLSYVEGKGYITYVVYEKELENTRKSRSVMNSVANLNLLTIHSVPELEDTPGVIAHVLDSLAAEGINVVEFISCYTDTLLVIKQADTARAYEIISDLTS
jgi:hypothetical protein